MSQVAIIYTLGAIVILLAVFLIRLEIRMRRLLAGKNAESLEDTIVRLREELTKMFEYKRANDERLMKFDERLGRSVQWVETVRFNPFSDQGGKQSFSTIFANEKGDGVVLTGLYSREKSSVYAKPLKSHSSEYELSDEERSLIDLIK